MIKSIAIKNYRGIKDLEIDNFKKYNRVYFTNNR